MIIVHYIPLLFYFLAPIIAKMSMKTMPLLFFNLGGEMLYILDQRLQAQKISSEKCAKVINDIIKTMIASSFVEELFKNQVILIFVRTFH